MTKETVLYVVLIVLFAAAAVFGFAVKSCFEASAFNRATGQHVSTWDAMWVDLRVMWEAK